MNPSGGIPFDPQAVFKNALALRQAGRLSESEAEYRKILGVYPEHPELNANFALVLRDLEKFEESANCCRIAIRANPNLAEAYATLGAIEMDLGQFEVAVENFDKALTINPTLAAAGQNKALALMSLGRARQVAGNSEGAIEAYRSVLELSMNHPDARNNLAVALSETGQLDAALVEIDFVVSNNPNYVEAHLNRGNILRDLGRNDAAVSAYQKVLELDPNSVDGHLNLGLTLLCLEQFEAGWQEFDWRWQTENLKPFARKFAVPEWQGEALNGHKLLIWTEQGLGDEILFSTILPDVIGRIGADAIIFECETRLAGLYQRTYPYIQVISKEKNDPRAEQVAHPSYDVQISAGSLARHFRARSDDFPGEISSLLADPEKKALWSERISALGPGLKVGIAWRGGMLGSLKKRKSIELTLFEAILRQENCHFINLQYGDCRDDLALAKNIGVTVHDWPDVDPLADLETQTAQIANLDLVIQTSNASVHLAGALNIPIWNLVAFSADWRWGHTGERSLWYPSMRICRQETGRDWEGLIRRVADELGKFNPS